MKYRVKLLKPAKEFLSSLPDDVYDKINYNIQRVLEGCHDRTVFKKLTGHEIWEIRTRFKGQQYRLFTFFDKYTRDLVVVASGMIKKTEKVPPKVIKNVEQIVKEYYLKNYPDKK